MWDIREVALQLASLGLNDERLASTAVAGFVRENDSVIEVSTDVSATIKPVVEQKARAAIVRYQRAVAARSESAGAWNNLAWAYLTAPEPLRDPAQGLAMAEKAVRLDSGNAAYRNTLGVAYYRAGRYREAIDLLRSNIEAEEDRSLVFDLCFLAMSYQQLGETPRAGIPQPRPAMDALSESARARRSSRARPDLARDGGDSRPMTTDAPACGLHHRPRTGRRATVRRCHSRAIPAGA